MKELKEYIIKYIELKYDSTKDYHHKDWGFGHDWNKMFPENIEISMPVRDAIYTALCVMFEYKPYLSKLSQETNKDFRIEDIIAWLRKEELSIPPHSMHPALKNGTWLLYYLLKIHQK